MNKKESYKDCKSRKIGTLMKLYKNKQLKTSGRVVKNPKQAIAIAINTADKQCKQNMTKKDMDEIKAKVKATNILTEKLKATQVKNTLSLLGFYKKEKNTRMFKKIETIMLKNIL